MKDDAEFKSVLDRLETLQIACGLHTRREKELLWRMAKKAKEQAIVEIGSFEGYSTIVLAEAAEPGTKILAVDPHVGKLCEADAEESPPVGDTWQTFNRNIRRAGVGNRIQGLKLRAEEAARDWQKPIGLLFIDGSHRYEDVKKDLLLWRPHLSPGSTVVFHDMWTLGVRRVLTEYILPDQAFGDFEYGRCCAFAARYFGNEHHAQLARRSFWRFLFMLRGAIEARPTLSRWLHSKVRWVS